MTSQMTVKSNIFDKINNYTSNDIIKHKSGQSIIHLAGLCLWINLLSTHVILKLPS